MTQNTKPLKDQIQDLLQGENTQDVERFAAYCQRIAMEKNRDGSFKYPFMQIKKAKELAQLFKRVKADGLVFDGKHVTLQSTGITYDYVAYKNKMLTVYPETKFDLGVVVEGDTFSFSNDDGVLTYSHKIADPFAEKQNIIGAFCVIRNTRGDFLTTLNKADIAKHRAVAKTDKIWSSWFKEMVLKTVIKKATKYHFDDIYEGMNEKDNESIDLDAVLPEQDAAKVAEVVAKLESFTDLKEMQTYFMGLAPQFIKNGDVFEAYSGMKEQFKSGKVDAPEAAPEAPATPPAPRRAPAKAAKK